MMVKHKFESTDGRKSILSDEEILERSAVR